MKTIAKNMVQNTTWYLGGTTYKTSNPPYETYPVNELYESEKGIKVYSGHATTSTDYIGLIYQVIMGMHQQIQDVDKI